MKQDPPLFPVYPPASPSALAGAGWYVQVFFLTIALLMALFHPRTQAFTTFAIIFSAIILEALPFMLLGTLISGIVEVFISREQLVRFLPESRRLAITAAAFLGILFPVCECAVVPVVRKFIQKGMPLGSAVAFLLGGPIVNPLVFGSTLVAYGLSWETAILRVFFGAAIAIAVGLFITAVISEKQALVSGPAHTGTCGHDRCNGEHSDNPDLPLEKKIIQAVTHGAADFYDIGRFLVMGAFIAAALQTLVERQLFLSLTGTPFLAMAAMMALAVALNLCSEADAFIAASFKPLGIPFSAQMAFMVLGPMLDIKLILMYLGVFSRKMILVLILSITLMVFLAMAALEVSPWSGV